LVGPNLLQRLFAYRIIIEGKNHVRKYNILIFVFLD
jgi:hypothetical protein